MGGLGDYVEITKASAPFSTGLAEEDIEVEKVRLPAGDAARFSYSNVSATLGIQLSHLMYIVPGDETAFIVTFTAPVDRMEEMTPLFTEIADTIETYEPID